MQTVIVQESLSVADTIQRTIAPTYNFQAMNYIITAVDNDVH